jgi:two-component system cell cycle sensor histidine kinase/response regulator CckA
LLQQNDHFTDAAALTPGFTGDGTAATRNTAHGNDNASTVELSLQVIHDLQSFLSVICMAAEAAEDIAPDGRPPREYLTAIRENAIHATRLCAELRSVLRNEAQHPDRSIIELSELVRSMKPLLENLPSRESVIHFDLAEGLPQILANPSQIREALLALVTNAAEALQNKSGCILVRTRFDPAGKPSVGVVLEDARHASDQAGGVVLEVCDTGCGAEATTVGRLCDQSFTTKANGSGLGLASVRRIIREHHGWITIDTEQGAGATLSCFLPLTHRHREDELKDGAPLRT